MENETFPVLYILMRNDLPSMNAGKAMAQASHASNAFVSGMMGAITDGGVSFVPDLTPMIDLFHQWENSTPQSFGTVLVLAVNEVQMNTAVDVSKTLGFAADVILDPTYPYQTTAEVAALIDPTLHTLAFVSRGSVVTAFRNESTCAYVFGDKNDPMLSAVVGNFPLYP